MNDQQRAAMQMALEALEFDGFTPDDVYHRGLQVKAITALREVLAQPQGEPVAWMSRLGNVLTAKYMEKYAVGIEKETHTIPLYTTPPSVEAAHREGYDKGVNRADEQLEAMRIETLEKAAKVCKQVYHDTFFANDLDALEACEECAAAIRGMK